MAAGQKQSNRPNRNLIKTILATPKNITTCNAKLIKYSSQARKLALWGAFEAPEGEFGGGGVVCDQFGIVFADFDFFSAWSGSLESNHDCVCLLVFWGPPF